VRVVTSGFPYVDIDAYAGCIAYAELLRAQGQDVVAASSAPWNESITPTVRAWGGELATDYISQEGDEFVLVDVSNPDSFDKFVSQDAVVGIIDHHPGLEDYWRKRLGDKAIIEFIGAACTLVYEQFEAAGKLDQISQTSARLLLTGILDNTLNFKAHVTTDRDKKAYDQLLQRAALPADWPAQYFSECQQAISTDLRTALKNDTKAIKVAGLPSRIGQLVIWDASVLLRQRQPQIVSVMGETPGTWAVNVVSIGEGNSSLLADSPATLAKLAKLLGLDLQNGVAKADRLWLRKEIMKAALQTRGLRG
jgi:inorganic pyrophosphatase/exopolyphosphatase